MYIVGFNISVSWKFWQPEVNSQCLAMAAREHGAVEVDVAVAGGVPAELSRLFAIVECDNPVTITQTKVATLKPEGTSAVSVSLIVNGHPVRAVLAVDNNALRWGSSGAPGRCAVNASLSINRPICLRVNLVHCPH